MERVETLSNGGEGFKLEKGGTARIRRVRRGDKNDLLRAAGQSGESSVANDYVELLVRWGIVGVENLTDPETGGAVDVAKVKQPGLGFIAGREVYNALSDQDVDGLFKAINAAPGEAAAKN